MPVLEKEQYNACDCDDTGYTSQLSNKVIVVNHTMLPGEHPGQLFFCSGEGVTNPHIIDKTVFAISLSTGEHHRFGRSDVIGALKPELMPDDARMHLSQIRPSGAADFDSPDFSGYCFLEDGRYCTGVWLRDAQEAVEFAAMQAPYQHRVMICDRDDFSVMEMTGGNLAHISQKVWDAYEQGGAGLGRGGMSMT